jgi:hypothetical protein
MNPLSREDLKIYTDTWRIKKDERQQFKSTTKEIRNATRKTFHLADMNGGSPEYRHTA